MFRTSWQLLKDTTREWRKDNALRIGAALSYYTLFSLPPLLFVSVAIAGLVFEEETVRGQLLEQVRVLGGDTVAKTIQVILENTGGGTSSFVATVIGILFLFIGATAVFSELQLSLNAIWGIREKSGRPFVSLLRTRLLSFAMVVSIGYFILVFLALSTLVAAFEGWLKDFWSVPPHLVYLLRALNFTASFLIITVFFAMIYKVLPYAEIAWRDVLLGAAATAFLFTIGKLFIDLYLRSSGIVSAYLAVGSLIVLVVWIYFSVQIFLFGAEFTQVYARWRGREIAPYEHAEWITKHQEENRNPQGKKEDKVA